MRVALDVTRMRDGVPTGASLYTAELFRALRRQPAIDVVPVTNFSHWRNLRPAKVQGRRVRHWLPTVLVADVLHRSDLHATWRGRAARVETIHDLAFLTPGMAPPDFAARKKRQLDALLDQRTPDAVIASSVATRRALVAYRPSLAERVHTVLLGGDHVRGEPAARDAGPGGGRPYFLFVGNLEARKNVSGIVAAFERVCGTRDDVDIVLIGKQGYGGAEILARIQESPCHDRILALGYRSARDLEAYYRAAVALVYPSWIEGFGLPVLEAMRLGCPVVTSATTATAEIAGDTGWLVDPADVDAIARAMLEAAELAGDPARRGIWTARAERRAGTLTWERCARETAAVYELARA